MSSKFSPSTLLTELYKTQHAFVMESLNSIFVSNGQRPMKYSPLVGYHSTCSWWSIIRCFTVKFLLGYDLKTNFESANASSPSAQMSWSSLLGRSFAVGIFNSFLLSKWKKQLFKYVGITCRFIESYFNIYKIIIGIWNG